MAKAARSELKSTGYEIFIGVLSILSIVNLVLMYTVVNDEALNTVLRVMNILFSAIFLADFAYRLTTAPQRGAYFFRHYGWADLLASLPFAELKILRLFRIARVVRLMRDVGPRTLWRTLIKDRAGSALYALLLMGVLVLQFGSLTMLFLEEHAPGANITTASDALWYTIVTISTVGYGDYYPVTNPGRIAGVVIIIVGVGIFGTFTGYLANLFLAPRKQDAGARQAGADSAAATPNVAVPEGGTSAEAGGPESLPTGSGGTLDEIRALLASSEANLESIKLLLGGPDRPAS
ncbi:ion transporter [Agromyces sp. Marseille-Q5079]|uniref:ion transporter n=1 Tax=Agromyces sp. Marseille-Q5079 TaxID=3439059 RepID=UPI003D9C8CB0